MTKKSKIQKQRSVSFSAGEGSRDSFIVKSLTTRPRRLSELNINELKPGVSCHQAVDRSHSEGSTFVSEKESISSAHNFGPRSLQALQNRQNRANIALERINEIKLLSTQAKLTSNGKAPLIRKLFHKLCSTKLIPK